MVVCSCNRDKTPSSCWPLVVYCDSGLATARRLYGLNAMVASLWLLLWLLSFFVAAFYVYVLHSAAFLARHIGLDLHVARKCQVCCFCVLGVLLNPVYGCAAVL